WLVRMLHMHEVIGSSPITSTSQNLKRTTLSESSFRFFSFLISLYSFQSVKKTLPIPNKKLIQNGVKTQSLPHREYGRIAKRFSGERPFPCALSFALFRLTILRVLERRGVAEPLVYSSTRNSAKTQKT